MAEVIWTEPAQMVRKRFYLQGVRDFGTMVANKTDRIIEGIENDLAKWPTSGHPEQLLLGKTPLYRARPINDRFRIIYRYDEAKDMVYIEDIWDTRRNPETLKQRINI